MKHAFNGEFHQDLFASLTLVSSFIGCCFALLLIILIRRVNDWTAYMYLLYAMACLEFVYDFSFFNSVVYIGSDAIMLLANTLGIFTELSISLLMNVIGTVALYVVARNQSIDLLRYVPHILSIIGLISLITVIFFYIAIFYPGITLSEMIAFYLSVRSVSLFVNILCSIATFILLLRSGSFKSDTVASRALRSFGYRMFCYPAVQILSRIPIFVYDVVYGYNENPQYTWTEDDDVTSSSGNRTQFTILCFFVVVTPLAAVGFFVFFLLTQPKAYPMLQLMLPRFSLCFSMFDQRHAQKMQQNGRKASTNSTLTTALMTSSSFTEGDAEHLRNTRDMSSPFDAPESRDNSSFARKSSVNSQTDVELNIDGGRISSMNGLELSCTTPVGVSYQSQDNDRSSDFDQNEDNATQNALHYER